MASDSNSGKSIVNAGSDGVGQGRAALLLVESLIHALVARSVLSIGEAVEITEIAINAEVAVIDAAVDPSPEMTEAVRVLSAIRRSLGLDLTD